jgi:hypothetical protein
LTFSSKEEYKQHIVSEHLFANEGKKSSTSGLDEIIYNHAIEDYQHDYIMVAIELFNIVRPYKNCDDYIAKCEIRAGEIVTAYFKVSKLKNAEMYDEAMQVCLDFLHLPEFKRVIYECQNAKEESEKEKILIEAIRCMDNDEMEMAIQYLKGLGEYSSYKIFPCISAQKLLRYCEQGVPQKYKLAQDYIKICEYGKAKNILLSIKDYRDSSRLVSFCEEQKKEKTYMLAIEMFNNGDKKRAAKLFRELNSYKKSLTYLRKCKM